MESDYFEDSFRGIEGTILKTYIIKDIKDEERIIIDRTDMFKKNVELTEFSKNLIAPSRNIFTTKRILSNSIINFAVIDYCLNIIDRNSFDINKESLKIYIEDKPTLRDFIKLRRNQDIDIVRTNILNEADRVIYPSKFRDSMGYKIGSNILLKVDILKNLKRLEDLTKHFETVDIYLPIREIDKKDYKTYVYLYNYKPNSNNINTKNFFINHYNKFLNRRKNFINRCIRNMIDNLIIDNSDFDFIQCESELRLY